MILNAYAVLDAFTVLLRFVLGFLIVSLGLPTWYKWRATEEPERRSLLEERSYFIFLLATVLLVLNLASWPLLYMLLESYVPEWEGVMCIYGVMQIGSGSLGPSRFLPGLLTWLQLTKPMLVFLTGAWFTLYLINRRTRTGPLMPRVLLTVVLVGLFSLLDSTLEGAYLAIPKKEEFPAAGCCTQAFDVDSHASKIIAEGLLGDEYRPWLFRGYYVLNIGMCLCLTSYILLPPGRRSGSFLGLLGLGALLSVPVNLAFLIDIAAPALLHLPHHHCPYDLIPAAPQSTVAVGLFAMGNFATGWACLAGWWGRSAETRPLLGPEIGKLLGLALFGYICSVAMLTVLLALA
jgi:hypothetical protein